MHKNVYWNLFLIGIALVVLWYTGDAFYRVYQYNRLNAITTTISTTWSITKLSDEDYILKAQYRFKDNQNEHEGETSFIHEKYWNAWGAEHAIPEKASQVWTVWYSKTNPKISSLQKNFPTKECVSACILWGILFYFLWFGRYVSKYRSL